MRRRRLGLRAAPKLPPQRPIHFPPDVADSGALRELLSQTDVFGPAVGEAERYLDDALERFRITMALVPPLAPGAKVLELGANPYFVTRLLRQRGLEVRAANWFGERSGFGDRGTQSVLESGIPHEYEFDHFNIEDARFPYEDSSFDLVLFCEILEHLPHNPTHALVEIHRVLRDGGHLLLTTPNANRLENLIKVQQGENMYEPLSGYGPYGRHNREYTVSELRAFLDECGYTVEDIFAQDLKPWPDKPILVPGLGLEHRGENLFVMARTRPSYRWHYPPWLYTSIHGFRRVVREDLVVGINCEVQATGLHHLEAFDGRLGRWTIGNAEASALVSSPNAGLGVLRIEGRAPDIGGTIELRAATSQEELFWVLPCNGEAFDVEGKAHFEGGDQTIRIRTDRFWRPCDMKDSADARELGLVLHRVSTDPQFGKPTGREGIAGSNCEMQLYGVHPLEDERGEPAGWANDAVLTMALLVPDYPGESLLTIQGCTPDLGGAIRLFAEIDGQPHEWALTADGHPFKVTVRVTVRSGEQVVRLWTDRPSRPSDEQEEETDNQTLGILLRSITVETLAPPRFTPSASASPVPLSRRVFKKLPPEAQALARKVVNKLRT